MALDATQKIKLAEITQETLETVENQISSLTISAELETYLEAKMTLWDANHDDVDVELRGEVDYRVKRLLLDLRMEVRNALGFPLLSEQIYPSSGAVETVWVF